MTNWMFLLLILAMLIFLAFKTYAVWLICIASDRQFNRRLAKLRARHVDWREWRRPKPDEVAR